VSAPTTDGMRAEEVLEALRGERALLEGHFLLSSGLRSDRYVQCALALANPALAEQLARAVCEPLKDQGFELVVGPALGAVVWAQEVGRALGLRAYFTERKDGEFELRRGFKVEPGQKILVVEDVVTTGGSAKEVVKLLRELGAEPTAVASIVNRSGTNPFEELGLAFHYLVDVNARVWSADDVPADMAGTEPVKPGSRPGA
jgi:orotate phosphoribosyltransferase